MVGLRPGNMSGQSCGMVCSIFMFFLVLVGPRTIKFTITPRPRPDPLRLGPVRLDKRVKLVKASALL